MGPDVRLLESITGRLSAPPATDRVLAKTGGIAMQSATQSQDVIRPFFEVLENRLLLANTIVDFFPMPPGETWTYQANVDGSTSTVTTTVSPTPVGVGGIACKELRNSVSGSYVSSEFMNLTTTGLYLKQLVTIEPSWLVNGTGTTVVTEIFAGNGQVQAFNALTVPGGFSANGNLTGSTSEGINWTGSWNESTTTSWEAVTVTAGAFNAYKIVYTGSETRFGTYINNSWREEIGWTKTTRSTSRWPPRTPGPPQARTPFSRTRRPCWPSARMRQRWPMPRTPPPWQLTRP